MSLRTLEFRLGIFHVNKDIIKSFDLIIELSVDFVSDLIALFDGLNQSGENSDTFILYANRFRDDFLSRETARIDISFFWSSFE